MNNSSYIGLKAIGLILFLLLAAVLPGKSQTFGIGIDAPEAILDVTSTSSGILIPRVSLDSTTDVLTIPTPITSELVYNTDTAGTGPISVVPGYYYWDGSEWVHLSTGEDSDWFEVSTTKSPDLITDDIYTFGMVGIGMNTPGAPLEVEASGIGNPASNSIIAYNPNNLGTNRDAIIAARVVPGDGDPFFSIDVAGESGWSIGMDNSHDNRLKIANDWSDLSGSGGAATKMVIKTTGEVGIGTDDPLVLLHVVDGQAVVDSVQIGLGRNDDGRVKFTKDGWGRIGAVDGLAFWANDNVDTDDNPSVFFHSNGRVGIGTTSADPKGLLEVNGYVDYDMGSSCAAGSGFAFFARDASCVPNTGSGYNTIDISIYASNRVVAKEFDAKSDARIKLIKGISDGSSDLETLMGIEITNYELKDDQVNRKPYKKVIGQQVGSVYPQAVSLLTDVVPDIHQLAEIKDGHISLPNSLTAGERVQLIFPDRVELVEVITADQEGFDIESDHSGEVFVYGREVDDFHVVDYEALSMLNISATQELMRLLEQQKDRINELEENQNSLSAELKSLQDEIDEIKGSLQQQVQR